MKKLGCLLLSLIACGGGRLALGAADPAPEGLEFFEKRVRPVLAEHCYQCHSHQAKKPKGGLFLDSRAALLKGGDNGPVLVPGQPEKSRLVAAIQYQNVDLQMPPKGRLPDAAIADLATWVKMGAPWPAELGTKVAASPEVFDLAKRRRDHWAWQPIRAPAVPAAKDAAWPRRPVDAFILARLEAEGLSPAPAADPRTLLRRAYFDLIGLPPTPREVQAFLADGAPNAYECVIDRLLAAPHFGERWGRHWLDLVRYAESRGHELDFTIPNAFHYRDYVVRALNADVPYDQLVVEHLAGDLLDRPRRHPADGFNESLLGTGFWFLGEAVHSPVDIRQDEADRFDNMIDVMSKAFLGLTVACARCHDHKYDAIATRDYYALMGFLQSSSYRLARFETLDQEQRVAAELGRLRDQQRPAFQRAVAESLRPALANTADYLLAAREVLRAAAKGLEPRRVSEAAALDRQLKSTVLEQWVLALTTAAKDAGDPLHAWAAIVDLDDPKQIEAVLRRNRQRQTGAAVGIQVVIDYANNRPEDWLPDGVAFGAGPVQPGRIRFRNDPAQPIAQVFDYVAAEVDPLWENLRPAPHSENDSGGLDKLVRAGRTLRTPTFEIGAGRVCYLVKGTGQAYAAVDSHTMIAGPLHGQLVLPIKGGAVFQWVTHDLSAYKGHRTHVEFTAAPGSPFAVACVGQAEKPPVAALRPNRLLNELLGSTDGRSLETLAQGYGHLLTAALTRLESDRLSSSPDATDHAQLANWVIQRPALFPVEDAARARVAQAASPMLAEQAKLAATIKNESRLALAMLDGSGEDEYVFIRGNPKTPGEPAPRRFLEALAGPRPLAVARGSGRLELARQMTDPKLNPFIARVLVNRIWQHLLGRGLVASVDNFGVLGERPTHPELLDFLAEQFVRNGWSIKRLIRELMLSSTYRMTAEVGGPGDDQDPDNRLLHRMRTRRLEGEALRDALLAVSGRLDRRLYGPPVPVHLTAFMEGRGRPTQSGPLDGDGRRSLYLAVRRNFLPPLMLAFDTPIPFATVGRRTVSNVPAQALILMNDPFLHQQAEVWARRLLTEPVPAPERITTMYLTALARPPTAVELTACLEFLDRQAGLSAASAGRPPPESDPAKAWTDLAHVLFNMKEFVFLK